MKKEKKIMKKEKFAPFKTIVLDGSQDGLKCNKLMMFDYIKKPKSKLFIKT